MWEIIFLIALTIVGLEIFIFDPNGRPYYRKLRLGTINFLLFVFAATCSITFLGVSFQEDRVLYASVITGVVSLVWSLVLIIWVIPVRVTDASAKQEDDGTESSVAAEKPRRFLFNLLYSIVLFLFPLILAAHVHRHSDTYLETLGYYEAYLTSERGERSVGDGLESQVRSTTPVPPISYSKDLRSYARAINLHFLTTTTLTCQSGDIKCLNVQNRLAKVQGNRVLFLIKVMFYFLAFYLILCYYAQVIQVSYDHESTDHQGLGLRQDVIKQCSQVISVAVAFLAALIVAGVDFTSLGVFGGLIGAGLSVALRDMLGNLVAGILLLWDKTIKKKDVITVAPSDSSDTGGTYAIVEKMTMRYTVVQDRNEVRRLIPNSLLTNNIVENWTHEDNKVRLRVLVGVDYGTDLRLARTILESVCYEVDRIFTKDRFAPKAVVLGFGDWSINFALRFWIEDAQKGIRPVLSDLYIAIYERFKEENISIPYPRRDLRIIPNTRADEASNDVLTLSNLLTAK
jgi:small-conductance mechanosensitive channel